MNVWNIINSIHSIRTTLILLQITFPPPLHILHSLIYICFLQTLCILMCIGENLTVERLEGITCAGLATCPSCFLPVDAFSSTLESFKLRPSCDRKGWENQPCTKSDHKRDDSSFPWVYICSYSLHLVIAASRCICRLQSGSIVLAGHNFFWCNESAPPSASHLCMRLGVCWQIYGHCCCVAHNKSWQHRFFLSTLIGFLISLC